MINDFFNWCVFALEVIGDFTGIGEILEINDSGKFE